MHIYLQNSESFVSQCIVYRLSLATADDSNFPPVSLMSHFTILHGHYYQLGSEQKVPFDSREWCHVPG